MNINDLVTHYVAFRRTLGEQCKINEGILRSFCRAVGPQTPVSQDHGRGRGCVLGRHRPDHQDVALQVPRAEGLLPVRGQPRAPGPKVPLPTELPKQPPTLRPVHLLT